MDNDYVQCQHRGGASGAGGTKNVLDMAEAVPSYSNIRTRYPQKSIQL